MSRPKYGRLPVRATRELIAHVDDVGESGNAVEDVYAVLFWLADNGWDVVKARKP